MENISEFNTNIAILYEKDSSQSKQRAIQDLLACDEIGLEIVKRFVLDRSNRVSVRLLAIIELWHKDLANRDWLVSMVEDENEYLFLQKDFVKFLKEDNEDQWLEQLSQSGNQQLKREAQEQLLGKLHQQINDLNLSVKPYKETLELESRKLDTLSQNFAAEQMEEERLHKQIAEIHEKLQHLQARQSKLKGDISQQEVVVQDALRSLEEFEAHKQDKLNQLQHKIQSLSGKTAGNGAAVAMTPSFS